MSSRSLKFLAIAVVVLFAALYFLNTPDRSTTPGGQELLFPELKARLNDIQSVQVTDNDGSLPIEKTDDGWIVAGKYGYPANTSVLRTTLIAIADARKVERKTSDPKNYARLGVQSPTDDESDSVLVSGTGNGVDFSVILGNAAQGSSRYVRLPDQEVSWLVDQDPKLPDSKPGWLAPDILDIDPERVASVTLRHSDGETIELRKKDRSDQNFDVANVPEKRSLSYPTVANPIGGALNDLTLEDIEPAAADETEPVTRAVFTTFDGLQVDVAAVRIDDATWITLNASVIAAPANEAPSGDASAPADEDKANDDAAGETATESVADDAASAASTAEQAASINSRTSGWRYRVAGYKADQFTRRWDDILQAADE